MSQVYQIVIFTASHQAYADVVLDQLDPSRKYITKRLFREHCIMSSKGVYVKDLRIFANVSQENLILIDNSPHCYVFNKCNGIPIIPFYDNYQDYELLKLSSFLKKLAHVRDVRPQIEGFFRLRPILDNLDDIEKSKQAMISS